MLSLAWRLLTGFALLGLQLVAIIRDWKLDDRRTKRYHKVTRVILVGSLMAGLSSITINWYDGFRQNKEKEQSENAYSYIVAVRPGNLNDRLIFKLVNE